MSVHTLKKCISLFWIFFKELWIFLLVVYFSMMGRFNTFVSMCPTFYAVPFKFNFNQLLIFHWKFSPLPGFEPETSPVPSLYATNWAILAWIVNRVLLFNFPESGEDDFQVVIRRHWIQLAHEQNVLRRSAISFWKITYHLQDCGLSTSLLLGHHFRDLFVVHTFVVILHWTKFSCDMN